MISILIPVFNVNVQSLVQELSNQLKTLKVGAEIRVYDDYSDDSFKSQNNTITSLAKVFYKELDENLGRTAIRQLLAKEAQYDWLLFIDSDSTIINKNYLHYYLLAIDGGYDVYAGGRIYQAEEPADCNKRLHWKYGTERESIQGSKNVLHSNNFCIRKTVFLQLQFPAQLTGYGHEDTWMELALIKAQQKIQFIDNPVLHSGLEDSTVFLEKTRSAVKNLLLLPKFFGEETVKKKVRLYRLFYWQHKLGLHKMYTSFLNKRIRKIEENLQSCNPSLLQFDLYRLYILFRITQLPFTKRM